MYWNLGTQLLPEEIQTILLANIGEMRNFGFNLFHVPISTKGEGALKARSARADCVCTCMADDQLSSVENAVF